MSTQLKQLKLRKNQSVKYDEVITQLLSFGYERNNAKLSSGQFLAVGDTIKVFSAADLNPVAIEFWGDKIESIHSFSIPANKKIHKLLEITIPNNFLSSEGKNIESGKLVVHEDHGIGIYRGKILKKLGDNIKKFYTIEYANGDNLFVPDRAVDKITSYQGIGRRTPRLSRLGSVIWQKTKKKIQESIIVMAKELLEVYAQRELITKNRIISIDKSWDKKLAETFSHVETPDQELAIKQIYDDLESKNPMDRLLIGDVGFGKTEVAIRAATQVINNNLQAVILAPTTILSRQHFKTIEQRLESFPIKIAELSRFIPKRKQAEIITDFSDGKIDLLIGTHKILSSHLNYKNLGLLIIDEEQKFGVKDKEKIKFLKYDIDVLSMSATPIPRTLFISMSGIRNISVIKTPPKNRRPIMTKVEQYDENNVAGYLKDEISRFGQVYFLHNEVKTITARAKKIRNMLPKARVAVAHGQMTEELLAATMSDFATGRVDILICSTIIENGLDIPSANTLIVEQADKFGLSQLYQLRGRIGRGTDHAFAYFTFKKKLVGNAYKRLQALTEKVDLGSGFDIAFSDLEIRGGGNILGQKQHGNMEELGLILYTKLLKHAVERIKHQS